MFSKFTLRAAILACTLSFTLSCGIHLGETAPDQKAIQYSGKGYSCIGEIPQHFEAYINNELNEDQISEFTHCLQRSLTSFMALTSDRHQLTYRPEDIRRFLQDYFLRKRTISDGLLHQFMKVKQVLVGGSLETITRPELISAIELLEDIRRETIRLKPYLPYLNSSLVMDQSERNLGQHLSQANEALNHSIDVFASKLKNTKMSYRISDLAQFMTEFRGFVDWEGHFKTAHTVEEWIALLKIFKEIAVSPEHPDVIPVEEWTPLLQSGARWYLSFLEYKVGVRSQGMLSGAGLQNVIGLGGQLLDLAADAVKRQPTQTVTYDQLSRLAGSLRDMGWIPNHVNVCSLDKFFRALIGRMFGSKEVRTSKRISSGLTLINIDLMRGEFDRWATVQSDLDHQFNPEQNPVESLIGIQNSVPRLHIQDAPATTDGPAAQNTNPSDAWDDFIRVKKMVRPLFANDLPRVMLVPDSRINTPELNFGFYNLSAMNLMRSGVQIMFNGYAEDNKWFWSSGITGEEMQNFYLDIRDLGIDLGIVDRRNKTSGSRAFIEGKLFTYASLGLHPEQPGIGSEMSAIETITYLGFLYSGSSEATQIFNRLLAICPHGPNDINGIAKVERSCALEAMPELMNQYMRNMPYLLQYLNQSSAETKRAYIDTALHSAFQEGISDTVYLEKNEMTTVAVVIHYAEAVMTRYDVNQDGTLTTEEFEAAVPIFRGFIRKVAVEQASPKMQDFVHFLLDDANAGGAFYYILTYGKIPTASNYLTIKWYAWHRPNLALGRLELARVFKAIIQNLLASSKDKPPVTPDKTAKDKQCHADL